VNVPAIVPVFYREPRLAETLTDVAALRDRLQLELLVVVDVADPAREAEARAEDDPAVREAGGTALYRVGRRGFGSALRDGFGRAGGDAVIPIMGDCSDRIADIPVMVHVMERDGWDVVAGSRYMKGGRVVGMTTKQRLSHAYSLLIRAAGGPEIHDVSNAFKLYRRSVIESVATVADSFDISVELTVKAAAAGFRVGEIPTVWRNREEGRSHFDYAREVRNYRRWLAFVAKSRRRPRLTGAPGSAAAGAGTTGGER